MEEETRDEPRAMNDSRKRGPSASANVKPPPPPKPSLSQRWRAAQPTKMIVFWACLVSIILTIVIGFTWGGWVTAAGAQETAETMAKEAVVQRLAPICVAQFDLDPDKTLKLGEMNDLTSSGRNQFVRDQGWATISGVEKPDRKVADACTKLLLEMGQ
jgi:hypothetical protein